MLDEGGYDVPNSGAFAIEESDYLKRFQSSSPTDLKKLTFSAWVKRASLSSSGQYHHMLSSGTAAGNYCALRIDASTDKLRCFLNNGASGNLLSDRVFRDVSSFYHVLVSMDTTLVTATDRCKIYINGELITLTGTSFALNTNTNFLSTSTNTTVGIGHTTVPALPLDGYMSEVYAIDGQALTPEDFAQTDPRTGQWVAKEYEGTYGSNGFYLNFQNGANLGEDSGGNGNNFTNTGVTQSTDTPTDNQSTLNYLSKQSSSTISVAGTELNTTGGGHGHTKGTIGVSSGKWYWEYTGISSSGRRYMCGISLSGTDNSKWVGEVAGGYGYFGNNGDKYTAGAGVAYGNTYNVGDVIGVALDMDTGDLEFFKNNVSQGVAFTGLVGTFHPSFSDGSNTYSANLSVEFPEASWTYAAPTGFLALSTKNLPEPAITKPTNYFAPIIYDDGAGAKTVGFQPDLVWMKARGATTSHKLVDSVRGVTKAISSDSNVLEVTEATGLTSFDTNGFTVGADTDYSNTTGTGMVAWSWKEGITQGFDIVQYSGTGVAQAINHNLGERPHLMIVKRIDAAGGWRVYHRSNTAAPQTEYLTLNTDAATVDNDGMWNDTVPTSTQFTVGTQASTNASGTDNLIAYLFTEVEGFSKIDSYTGNGSSNGPFVYCGFRPAYVMIKGTGLGSWGVFDVRRNEYNTADLYNKLDGTAGDSSAGTVDIDILSNGFKLRGTGFNGSSAGYTFLAFAELPFKYSRAR
tara:strand:- start:16625 stop:18856 length:2232 start_codon:yes stop_codon:yes gene_type:complete